MDEATTAAELPEVAAAAAPSTEAAPAAPADANSAILEFEELFTALTNQLRDLGYYQDRPEYTVPNKSRTELGMEKRALLTMARERIDILYSLPADKLSALAQQELPYVDRKVSPRIICSSTCHALAFNEHPAGYCIRSSIQRNLYIERCLEVLRSDGALQPLLCCTAI